MAHEFANKSSSLKTEMLEKLEHNSAENASKINEIEQLASDGVISSSQENKALKERLEELNRSLQMDISSVAKRFSFLFLLNFPLLNKRFFPLSFF